VRWGVLVPAALFSHRVFQKISLPAMKMRLTPASRAASTLARCPADQYSSWPEEMKIFLLSSSLPRRSESTSVV
jgi:hypothetical protein